MVHAGAHVLLELGESTLGIYSNSPLRQSVCAIALKCGGPGWMSATSLCQWGVGTVLVMHGFVPLIHYTPGGSEHSTGRYGGICRLGMGTPGMGCDSIVTDKRRQTGGLRVAGIVLVGWVWKFAAFCGAHS